MLDSHLIIGNQHETTVNETQKQIRFARSRRSHQKHTRVVARGAARVKFHESGTWAGMPIKGSALCPIVSCAGRADTP